VADSGLGYLENLCAADARHVRFVAPLRVGTGWAARFAADLGSLGGLAALQVLDHVSHWERRLPANRRTTWKGQVAGLLTVRTGTWAGKPWITWDRDQDAIAAASRLEGLYALATNLPDPGGAPLTALDVLKICKDQRVAGQRHRDLKQTLKVRPVFLHNDDRIYASSPSSASRCSSSGSSRPSCAPPSAPAPRYPASCPKDPPPSPPPAPPSSLSTA